MQIQVNSDRTVTVDARTIAFVEDEVGRILGRYAEQLTRVEVHLSDVNSRKTGPADKRCQVEVRPAGARPLAASATAKRVPLAVGQALRKVQRALSSLFGRRGWTSPRKATAPPAATRTAATAKAAVAASPAKPRKAAKAASAAAPRPVAEKTAGRSPKKKGIFLARRKAWPTRTAD
ncbi:MAG: HPF/RaiA family ribosome-associated protein [Vicinamibacterales bacterium]